MKRIAVSILSIVLCLNLSAQEKPLRVVPASEAESTPRDSFYILSPVEVKAIRAGENAPFTKTNLGKKEIAKMNLGQDIPFLLNQTPSVVVNSDAGNGVGYTGIRIRGTDATRINVTLNGIPYNDAESQGTFFVDLPDLSSSTGSIQVQRGVGTSSNGAGAFGGSINISTNEVQHKAYAEVNNSFGSFNTWKNTVKVGSGLLGKHFTTDFRISRINSDGYIDRASTDLKSLFFSTAYYGKKNSLRFNFISGKEKTYQAWNGVSEADLRDGNRTINYAGMEKPGEPYDNETDNFKQDHYQLFFNQQLSTRIGFNTALFYTKGRGYYEQYKADQEYSKYGLPEPVNGNGPVTNSDMVRQLWLDNDFYGNIFSLLYKHKEHQLTLGGGYTRYEGDHFGEVTWAMNGLTGTGDWYDLDAQKNDFNIYFKHESEIGSSWHLFYDLQYRYVKYNINGFRDNPGLQVNNRFRFFNPKAGISYSKDGWKGYLSYGIANKEPNREDFEAGVQQQPLPERLHDVEASVERRTKKYNWSATLYYMRYKDQLVLTGKINDVGAYTRTNIAKSYRAGIELQGGVQISKWLNALANITLSRNKVNDFTEYVDDYDNGGQKQNVFNSPDIAFSPAIVSAATINILPVKDVEISLLSKYVSDQYLDNTQSDSRKLDAFYVQDARLSYTFRNKWLKELNIIGQVNNIFNRKYEPNGYTYNYIYNGELSVNNYYFPMAGVNFMVGLNVRL
jgi:iron complex outermembrane recepter protein